VNTSSLSKYINTIGRNLIPITTTQPKQEQPNAKTSALRSIVGQQPRASSVPRCVPFMYSFYWNTSSSTSFDKRAIYSVNQSSDFMFIDDFLDCFLHFYNQNYDEGYQWYLKNFS
jgi:hypothetical protein